MQAVVRVVETGSSSAAARVLKVGKPAISKSVAQLEARWGCDSGVTLTTGDSRHSHGLHATTLRDGRVDQRFP
jgi:hypothetical protein